MSRSLYVKKKNLRWALGDTSVYSNITVYAALITTAPAPMTRATSSPSPATATRGSLLARRSAARLRQVTQEPSPSCRILSGVLHQLLGLT